MALRLYFVPKVFNVTDDAFVPKYFADGTIASTRWSGADFDDWYLLAADLSGADHTTVVSQPDASAMPVDLDTMLTAGQVTAIQNRLEGANIPAHWISTSSTWREVVRGVGGMIRLNQAFKGGNDGQGLFRAGIVLSSTVGDLPVQVRQRLNTAALSLGLDTSGVTLTTTLRAVLRNLGSQLQNTPFIIGSVTL